MKKIVISLLIIALFVSVISFEVRADATTFNVSTIEEFENAIQTIQENSNGNFIIKLNSDLEINNETSLPSQGNTINNGNTVTLIGNGHKITNYTFAAGRFIANGGTLNLGLENGSDSLYLSGPGENHGASESVVAVYNNGIINMYSGVTISNENVNHGAVTGGAVRIADNGTFNMYGGVMKDNKAPDAAYGGAVFIDGINGKFNMFGGELKNNTAEATYGYGGAVMCMADGAEINITGGKISGNLSNYGGAIAGYIGQVNIKNAVMENNTATAAGGAIIIFGYSSANLEGNTIKGNSAPYGGAVYSEATLNTNNDVITENTSNVGGGVYISKGNADFSSSNIYNNKAQSTGSDFYIRANATSISIKDAESMNVSAVVDNKIVPVNGWYTDNASNRYSLTNYTDKVSASDVTAGNTYALIAATDKYEINYDNDGKSNTDNVSKWLTKNSRIKITANGGTSSVDEINLTENTVLDNPTRENMIFTGWSEESADGYDLELKANWREYKKYTVTFKVENGTWSDETTDDKTIDITENNEEKVILNSSDVPTEMKANEGYKNGAWNVELTSNVEINSDVTYTYTFERETATDPDSDQNQEQDPNANSNTNTEENTNTTTNTTANTSTETNTVVDENEIPEGNVSLPITGEKEETNSPITGDNLGIWIVIFGIAFIAFVITRKNSKNKKYLNII